jgi:tetrapyrrole methylase family protein/MazG family protein
MADGSDDLKLEEGFREVVDIVARLRAPGGCPWDREQTHDSIKGMTIEEAYEVAEAIDERDDRELMAELGDLLLQVLFHSQIAAEEQRFNVRDVTQVLAEKLVRRHPHVFGDHNADDSAAVLRSWEAVKAAERAAAGKDAGGTASMLDSVSRALPAVMEAFQMTTKAARVGFDWPDVAGAVDKVDEERGELARVLEAPRMDQQAAEHEVGDLLFAVINVARKLGVDPESALKATNRRFRRRFGHVEKNLAATGRSPSDATLEEMDRYWDAAKAAEAAEAAGSGAPRPKSP